MEMPRKGRGRRVSDSWKWTLRDILTLALPGVVALGVFFTMKSDVEHLKTDMTELKSDVKAIRERMDRCIPAIPNKLVGHP